MSFKDEITHEKAGRHELRASRTDSLPCFYRQKFRTVFAASKCRHAAARMRKESGFPTSVLTNEFDTVQLKRLTNPFSYLVILSESPPLAPSDTGARGSKVGVRQEKREKNVHISTVNVAVLPSLS